MTKRRESTSIPRGWTGGAAWKGAGASVLLHLFAGAAMIVALSGPPKAPPQVIDLTLLPPADIGRRTVPAAFVAATEPAGSPGSTALPAPSPAPGPAPLPETPVVSGPTSPPSPPAAANPPDGTARTTPSPSAGRTTAFAQGPSHGPAAIAAATGKGPVGAVAGIPQGPAGSGTAGPGSAAGNYAWLRDAIQRAIAYPATARRMGWEGKVVVAFHLLPDGSVRDVRIVQGSGHAALDRGAIEAVRNASPFPRSPGEAEIITPVLFLLAPSP